MHSHHDHARNVHHKEALRLALGTILAPKRPYTPISRSNSGSATPVYPAAFSTESLLNRPSDLTHLHSRPSSHSHSHTHLQHPHHPSPPSRLGRHDLTTPPGMAPPFPQSHYFLTHPHTAVPSPAASNSSSGTSTPEHSSVPGSASGSPPMANSPGLAATHSLNPASVPEEDRLQLLPPIVAAGSTSQSVESLATGASHSVHAHTDPIEGAEADHDYISLRDKALHDDHSHQPHENGGTLTPRARFIETLQSKNKAWDALIHGSFS
ncbi:hypothetical protein APHAL10511_002457 [Amanita phalloides]|nr:hypothetical protein APHAL10511_002457 [Amanita phalloides]